jgi:hypothetical protein
MVISSAAAAMLNHDHKELAAARDWCVGSTHNAHFYSAKSACVAAMQAQCKAVSGIQDGLVAHGRPNSRPVPCG